METLGFNSPSLNPENCRLNGDRKLLTQKIKRVDVAAKLWTAYFLHEVQFSAAIGAAHFLAETTRPLRPRLSAFSPSFISPNGKAIFGVIDAFKGWRDRHQTRSHHRPLRPHRSPSESSHLFPPEHPSQQHYRSPLSSPPHRPYRPNPRDRP